MNKNTSPNLDSLISSLFSALPEGLAEVKNETNQQLQAALRATLEKMNLVTRDEFDVQKAVLARTRSKLEELEKVVAQLEKEMTSKE